MIKIAVLGYGVVGSGVVELITKNQENIQKNALQNIEVKRILVRKKLDIIDNKYKFTNDFNDILNDNEISIVVEAMGGICPAFDYVKALLNNGKSVVTSNKELVSKKGAELIKIANEKGISFLFEASVGGGMPIIRPMYQCLAANNFDEIVGILNGTTNYILTKMINENINFDDAVRMAQDMGYAEKNPTEDVEGIDACRKICILASLAYGKQINPDNIYTQGITKITLDDVYFANKFNSSIKLIARAKRGNTNKIKCMVSPALVCNSSQLSTIQDVYNGIIVKGNATGNVLFCGKGAGKFPTASAVVADVIDAVKHQHNNRTLCWSECCENIVEMYESAKFLIRVKFIKECKSLIEQFFSITKCAFNEDKTQFAFITDEELEKDINLKISTLSENDIKVLSSIRVIEI